MTDFTNYKPSGKAWIGFSILCLSIVAIVYAVCASDLSVSVKGAYDIKINVGEKSQPITVIQNINQGIGL